MRRPPILSVSFLLSWSSRIATVSSFVTVTSRRPRSLSLSLYNDGDDAYDDFGGFVGGDDGDSSSSSFSTANLSDLMTGVVEKERERDGRVFRNWERGNWSVRGFSLDRRSAYVPEERKEVNEIYDDKTDGDDPIDNNDPDDPVVVATPKYDPKERNHDDDDDFTVGVCRLAVNENDDIDDDEIDDLVAVGRTDGSVYVVRLGKDPITKFTSVPELTMNEDSNVPEYADRMVRYKDPNVEEDDDENNEPFEIVRQFGRRGSGDRPVTAMSVTGPFVVVASDGIREWSLDDEKNDEPRVYEDDGSDAEVVALEILSDKRRLLSVKKDGTVSTYDRRTKTLVASLKITDDGEDVGIECADVDEGRNVVWFGFTNGRTVGYDANSLVDDDDTMPATPEPLCSIVADEKGGTVTAVECRGGAGTMSDDASVLVTGTANGSVKRWEILFSDDGKTVRHWPRSSSQKFRDAAHLLGVDRADDRTITCARTLPNGKIVLAADASGRIRACSTETGKTLYEMDGFEEGGPSSLCFVKGARGTEAALVTDGMDHMVCLHDFGDDDDDDDKDDEDDDEMDWLEL